MIDNEYPLNDPRFAPPREDDFNALIAEVERLRKECGQAYLQGVKVGREAERIAERGAVVAWLRTRERQIKNWPPGGMNEVSLTYSIIADAIERGEHRREEKP
jgi:hypothetical protein